MTGVELLAGAAVGYLIRKLRKVGGKADAEVDRVLDDGMDALHELISARLGSDGALERLRLEAQAGAETGLTVRRSEDAIAQVALDDPDFAARLQLLVEILDERAAAIGEAAGAGSTHNVISGTVHGSVLQGRDFTGSIAFGSAGPAALPGEDGQGKGAAPIA
ncbi:hypothetical protein AB0L00_41930 [Actinoallomurus sp. NPDC052308]|uniref:hypothetical protein n=1 Tax=Actinoallomurus sp. NPDC052308 TaxID=3155530 RepID=UPI00343C51CD